LISPSAQSAVVTSARLALKEEPLLRERVRLAVELEPDDWVRFLRGDRLGLAMRRGAKLLSPQNVFEKC